MQKRHEEHENHERWLVSYADFITLLFAFFVVMYATSTHNEEKEKKFEESIRSSLKMVGMAGGPGVGPSQISSGPIIEPLEVFQRQKSDSGELQESLQRLLAAKIPEEERARVIKSIRHDSVGVRISLAASEFFPMGSAKLRPAALKTLDKIAETLRLSPHRLIIEGHTDSQPIGEGLPFESNWELASLRATTVVRYFIKVHHINPQRLAAISYADQRPIVPNDSEENRAKNRRIEILIVNNEEAFD